MRTLQCRRLAGLPVLADGEVLAAMSATVDGRLIAVSVRGDRHDRLRGQQVRVHLHEAGDDWRPVTLTGATVTPSHVALLPGGEFLVVQARTERRPFEPVPDNAQVFDATGRTLRTFALGDGIQHLAVDEPGTIWVGYFDEGIYSGDPL